MTNDTNQINTSHFTLHRGYNEKKVIESDSNLKKCIPHGVDMHKEDLDGDLWWLQDNEYIFRGYRTQLSVIEAFMSAFRSTNETMNIWTHFIGTVLFILLLRVTLIIPVNTISTLQHEIVMTTATSYNTECSAIDYLGMISDHFPQDGLCYESSLLEDRIIEKFSYLYYHLSYSNHSQYIPSLTETSLPLLSCLSSNTPCTLHEKVLISVKSSVASLISTLWDWIESFHSTSYPDTESSNIYKAVTSAEELFEDLLTLTVIQKQAKHTVSKWPIIVFICCAIWCLGGSTIYHQYYCTSFLMSNILQTIDYCGICILISGSYVPIIYYCFYCYPTALWTHLIIIFVLNISNLCVMATPTFRQPEYRSVRAISFTLVSCYAVFAFIHIYLLEGLDNSMFSVAYWYLMGMGGTYILGAVLYGTRIPEKIFPGHFDYVFSSHQLFHVCIVIAALFHYIGSYLLFLDRTNTPCMSR